MQIAAMLRHPPQPDTWRNAVSYYVWAARNANHRAISALRHKDEARHRIHRMHRDGMVKLAQFYRGMSATANKPLLGKHS
jgi:hypothetical protein